MSVTTELSTTKTIPPLFASGHQLDPAHIGYLRDSSPDRHALPLLRQRMQTEGYLYFKGLTDRNGVLDARREVTRQLAEQGQIKPGTDPMDAVVAPGTEMAFRPDLAKGNHALERVIYAGAIMDFFHEFLGGPVRHFDFTWLRAVSPGKGTMSHCDSVYMNRGTQNLYTTWLPLGDVSFQLGGLMILEGSNNNTRLRETYGAQDVDAYCENKPDARAWGKSWGTGGWLKGDPNHIRQSVGGPNARWLTEEFRAGDVLIFTIFTVHASLDNRSADRIRFSSDSRYQLASEPADERWIGENPIAHGDAGKRGKIC
jgi:ectoine hydroxylase-related dioxygenase (phytanoyl-CoA dioxygenase family)